MKPVGLPSLIEVVANQIFSAAELTDKEKTRVLGILNQLPEDNCACHGDFHPGNIIVKKNGDPIIIDWASTTNG